MILNFSIVEYLYFVYLADKVKFSFSSFLANVEYIC